MAARMLVLLIALCGPAAAEEDPREALLQAQLNTLESLVGRLDRARAAGGAYSTRVWEVHRRLAALEDKHGLGRGSVSQRSDLGNLLLDANNLGARVRAVLLARAAAAAPERDAPDQGAFVEKPVDPLGKAPVPPLRPMGSGKGSTWPDRLTFAATAKVSYRHVGEWLLGEKHHSGWGPDFLQTGHAGEVSVSVRARDLVREVRSADLRVVVRLPAPFLTRGVGFRVLDVTWKSDRGLNNSALRTWMAADRLTIPGPYRWIREPKELSAPLDVQAHVRAVTLQDGTTFLFLAPEFVLR